MMGIGSLLHTKAPEFPENFTWLNTLEPLSLEKLKGHVVVLDFWTYCCMNCMHMVPVLENISKKFEGKPVAVIGVHSPKFQNEKNVENVAEAITRYEIAHPVIVDSAMKIWRTYGVNAWPTFVILDTKGNIAYRWSGETPESKFEAVITELLDRGKKEGTLAKTPIDIKRPKEGPKRVLSYPGKMSFSADGKRFVLSDSNHNRILVVETKTGRILEKIGDGKERLKDGDFDTCSFYRPQGVLWSSDQKIIYVTDTENHALRGINLELKRVKTFAGNGEKGYHRGITELLGMDVQLNSPWDLTEVDGKLYIAMAGLYQIWVYDTKSKDIRTFAGDGFENIVDGSLPEAEFAQPSGISSMDGHLYVADSEVSAVRSIDLKEKYVSTLVGAGLFIFGHKDGELNNALMQHPIGICASGKKVYVADTYNSAIRVIDLDEETVTTLIGKPDEPSFCRFDDPNCDTLGLYEPNDVKVLGDTLYIVDTNNHLVRTFNLKEMMLKTLKITE